MHIYLILILYFLAPGYTDMQVDKEAILHQINIVRKEGCRCGKKYMPPVPPLAWSSTLEHSSNLHAQDMARRDYFSHVTPEGVDVGERVLAAGYKWSYVGENIASGQKDFNQVLEDWMKSPVHCKLIMNPNFRETAVSRYDRKWVQHFGRKQE